MTAQGKITVSNPSHVAELNSLSLVEANTRKKQQKELAHLGALARMLEDDLRAAKSTTQEGEGETLAQLAYDLEMLKNTFQKFESIQTNDDGVLADAVINSDKKAGDKDELRKIWDKIKHLFEHHHHKPEQTSLLTLSTYFEELKKQEGKNQEKMLSTLISALKNLELAKTEGQGGDSFGKGMAELAYVLQMLQVTISQFGNIQAQNNYKISQKEVQMSQQQLHNLEKKLRKLEEKRKKEKIAKIFIKTAEYAAAGISALVAVALCQPELLVVTAVSLAAATGATKEITKGVADLIEMAGASKTAAEITAEVIVTVTITALCLLAAPAGAAEEASETTAEESTGALAKLSKLNPFRLLPKPLNYALFASSTAMTSTNLVGSIIEAIPMSQKKKSKYEMAAMITMAVLSLAISMGAGAAALEGVGTKAANNSEMLSKVIGYTPHLITATSLVQLGSSLAEFAYMLKEAVLTGDFAKINANLTLINATMQMSSDQAADDQKEEMSQLQSIRTGNRSITKLMEGEAEIARVLTEFQA